MQTTPCFLVIAVCLSLVGCELFEPYDYERDKDARFKLEDSGCSVGIHGKKLYLKKEFGEPKKHDKK